MEWFNSLVNGVPTIIGFGASALFLLLLVKYIVKNKTEGDKFKYATNVILRLFGLILFAYIAMTGNNGGATFDNNTAPVKIEKNIDAETLEVVDRSPKQKNAKETSARLEKLRSEQQSKTSLDSNAKEDIKDKE